MDQTGIFVLATRIACCICPCPRLFALRIHPKAFRVDPKALSIYGEGPLRGILEFTYQDVGEDPVNPGKRKLVGHHDVAAIFREDA